MQKGIIPGRTAAGIAAVGAISSQIGTSADADRTSDKAPLSRAQTRSQTKTTQPTTVQTPSHTQAEQLQEDSGLGASAHEKHHGPHAHQEAQHAVVSATAQDNPWTHCSMHGLSADSHQQRPHLPQSPQQQNVKASEQDCIPGQSIQTPVPSLKANTAKALITNQKPETCAALPTAASTAKASVTVKKPTDKRRRIMPDQQQSKKSRRRGEHGKVPQ